MVSPSSGFVLFDFKYWKGHTFPQKEPFRRHCWYHHLNLVWDYWMDDRMPQNQVPTAIHFIPSGPIDAAARKVIRAHVTLDIRRKQRQQKLLTLQARPSKPRSIFFEDDLCKCHVLGPSNLGPPAEKSSTSRLALQRQKIADSYKICFKCKGIQFAALSEEGQLRVARSSPSIVALLQTDSDPFNTLPEMPKLSLVNKGLINDIKAYCEPFSSLWDFTSVPSTHPLSQHNIVDSISLESWLMRC